MSMIVIMASCVICSAPLGQYSNLHYLVTEGGTDEAGIFHLIPRMDDARLEEIFGREVLADLVRKELLNSE